MFDAVTPLIGLPDHIKRGIENVCINEVRNESILKEDEKYCAFLCPHRRMQSGRTDASAVMSNRQFWKIILIRFPLS